MSDWQRRFDESVAREADSREEDSASGRLSAAVEASGLLPGWAGAIAVGLSLLIAAAAFIGRAERRAKQT